MAGKTLKEQYVDKRMAAHKADGYSVVAERDTKENWVTMNNALTRAGHSLTLSEKRLVMMAVSKLDSRSALPKGSVPTTRITATDYAEAFGVSMDTAYNQLAAAGEALFKRYVTFFEADDAKSRKKGSKPTKVQMHWVGEVHYQEGEGWIELSWWPKILPCLTGLKREFTTYQLKQASALRSVYSWRLLELLLRFKGTDGEGRAEYTVEDLKTSFDVADTKSYANYALFERRVLAPAVKEIEAHGGMTITYTRLKAGRRVRALRFEFKPKTPYQGEMPV